MRLNNHFCPIAFLSVLHFALSYTQFFPEKNLQPSTNCLNRLDISRLLVCSLYSKPYTRDGLMLQRQAEAASVEIFFSGR